METLYRRPLPTDQVAFSSAEGQRLFGEALAAGGLGGYFALAEQFQTQSDPAFCGLGSLVVALNALAIDPGRLWKGPWRWFSEELLDCCVSLDQVRSEGVDLDTLACLARCNGALAEVRRPADDDDDADDDAVRAALRRATAGAGEVMVAAYDRGALGQTGSGHFSPVGGYHAGRDLVLILDVARFKYPPHWIPVERLAAAMRTVDPATGRTRGWIELRRRMGGDGVLLSLACAGSSWPELARRLREALTRPWPDDTTLVEVAGSLTGLGSHCVARQPTTAAHAAAVDELRAALRTSTAHAIARDVTGDGDADATAAVLLLFARLHPPAGGALGHALDQLRAELTGLPGVAAEIDRLVAQAEAVRLRWPGPAASRGDTTNPSR